MTQFICFIAFVALTIGLCSCDGHILKGEGAKTTTAISTGSFNAIDIGVTLKAIISVQAGSQTTVEISGFKNLLAHIKTKTENNKLVIYSDLDADWNLALNDQTTLNITVPALEGLEIDGASDANIHGILTGTDFKLDISGAGKVSIDSMVVNDFSTVVSGTGDIEIKGGTVHSANYQVSGVGKIKAFPLQTSETVTSISGEGRAELTALQKLSVEINGTARVKYKGHPTLTQEISGDGTITNAN